MKKESKREKTKQIIKTIELRRKLENKQHKLNVENPIHFNVVTRPNIILESTNYMGYNQNIHLVRIFIKRIHIRIKKYTHLPLSPYTYTIQYYKTKRS